LGNPVLQQEIRPLAQRRNNQAQGTAHSPTSTLHKQKLAKRLNSEDLESFLVAKRRLSCWKYLNAAKGSYPERKYPQGLYMLGPDGVGKSSSRHVNIWIVIYVESGSMAP